MFLATTMSACLSFWLAVTNVSV